VTEEQSVEESGLDRALLLEQVLAAVLRKFVAQGDKIKINLALAGHETDIVIDYPDKLGQAVKLSWKDVRDDTGT